MSWAKNGSLICDECGKFHRYYDAEIPFGCADPENPEPYDPYHYCEKCSKIREEKWYARLKWQLDNGFNIKAGSWQKSKAETNAAKRLGLVWVHSNSIGTYGTDTSRGPYCYVTQEEYDKLSKLPRFKNEQ